MKIWKLVLTVAVAALVSFVVACGGGATTPKAVAEKFLTALKNAEFDKAIELATDDAKLMLAMLQSATKSANDDQKKEMDKQKGAKLTITKTDEQPEAAKVYYTVGEQPEQALDLIKKDGKWLVDFKKGA